MSLPGDAQKRIEQYLDTVRAGLHGAGEQDSQEFLEELRGHVQEKLSAREMTPLAVEKVLAELGDPRELAGEYKTNALLARIEGSRSPLRILPILIRWAGLSITGVFVLLGAISGYLFGGVLFACALLKPFHPHTAGLWAFHDATGDLTLSFRLGLANPPTGAHELLGWWIVPMGVLAAVGLVLSTSHLALWSARKLGRSAVFG
jgi:hypothetical protein